MVVCPSAKLESFSALALLFNAVKTREVAESGDRALLVILVKPVCWANVVQPARAMENAQTAKGAKPKSADPVLHSVSPARRNVKARSSKNALCNVAVRCGLHQHVVLSANSVKAVPVPRLVAVITIVLLGRSAAVNAVPAAVVVMLNALEATGALKGLVAARAAKTATAERDFVATKNAVLCLSLVVLTKTAKTTSLANEPVDRRRVIVSLVVKAMLSAPSTISVREGYAQAVRGRAMTVQPVG